MAILIKAGSLTSDFTVEGYNDKPKPCPKKRKGRKCKGMVQPTWNANVGKCDKCQSIVAWNEYEEET